MRTPREGFAQFLKRIPSGPNPSNNRELTPFSQKRLETGLFLLQHLEAKRGSSPGDVKLRLNAATDSVSVYRYRETSVPLTKSLSSTGAILEMLECIGHL